MYRFTALTSAALCWLAMPATAQTVDPALPDAIRLAQIRPSMPTSPDLVDEVVAGPSAAAGETLRPTLAARWKAAPKLVVKVDLSDQEMTVIVEGERRFIWPVSTGAKGYATPTGEWQPYRMHTMWHSRTYDNAPMPHSIFFTGGYAIHATPHVKRLGRPASHGCVRLAPKNAKTLFDLTKLYGRASMKVVVRP